MILRNLRTVAPGKSAQSTQSIGLLIKYRAFNEV